jgi:hypothetical protein
MRKLFEDSDGNFSTIRVMSVLAFVFAVIFSFTGAPFEVITIWVVAAFVPKAIQKFAENV